VISISLSYPTVEVGKRADSKQSKNKTEENHAAEPLPSCNFLAICSCGRSDSREKGRSARITNALLLPPDFPITNGLHAWCVATPPSSIDSTQPSQNFLHIHILRPRSPPPLLISLLQRLRRQAQYPARHPLRSFSVLAQFVYAVCEFVDGEFEVDGDVLEARGCRGCDIWV